MKMEWRNGMYFDIRRLEWNKVIIKCGNEKRLTHN